MLVIICIASAVSFYNYRSYCQDVIISETNNSANRVRTLSERLQVAYDEMVNIVLNCAERKSLFFATTLDSPNKPYNTSMTVYASDVLRDFCAISGTSIKSFSTITVSSFRPGIPSVRPWMWKTL